ncbi:GntR family transcriptional regulator [Roseovarius sp. M141]|uniref:GntR family transcriptional regulator n=1 Tax=Roseovarius sp. M141 TaxID=2583806 RepID=UPI0020CC4ADC|nr:GntR family transcriptional regulator [Roseovarius sp. M141]
MAQPRENSVDIAYDQLRAWLVGFRMKPGARLNESALAADLGMSRAPLREALNRLISDGLVRFEPGRGFFCRKLSAREIADLYAVRYDLEAGALTHTLQTASDADLAVFADRWPAISPGGDLDALVAADEDFHHGLARLAGNDARLRYLENINDRIRFVRRLNLEPGARSASAHDEHQRLLRAVQARDTQTALDALRVHLDRSSAEVHKQVRAALAQIYEGDIA